MKKLRTVAFLVGFLLLSLLVANLMVNRVVPFWTVRTREEIAARVVELFWEKGVRLVWEEGHKENLSSYGLSVKIGIPLPNSPSIYVEISSEG